MDEKHQWTSVSTRERFLGSKDDDKKEEESPISIMVIQREATKVIELHCKQRKKIKERKETHERIKEKT